MANIIVPFRSNNQGLDNLKTFIIDRHNPLSINLLGGFYSGHSRDNSGHSLVYGVPAGNIGSQIPGGVTVVSSKFGKLIIRSWSSSNQGQIVYHPTVIGVTEPRTILFTTLYSGAISTTKIAQVGTSFPQPGLYFGYGGDRRIYTEMRVSDSSYKGLVSSFIPETNRLYTTVVRVVPNSAMEMFIDGIFDQTTSLAGLNAYEAAWNMLPCAQQAGVPQVPLMFTWKRALSNAEIYNISINPMQLVKKISINRLFTEDLITSTDTPTKDIGGLIHLNKTIGGL
jgi:hypothetical protein